MRHACLILAALGLWLGAGLAPATAQSFVWADWQDVRVCPADGPDIGVPPDFASPRCESLALYEVDPQDDVLWVRTVVSLGAEFLSGAEPFGVYLSGKAASAVYLNGQYLGSNGQPGLDAASERPGRMDAVIFAPRERLREGDNELVIAMSSHHGLVTLSNPLHLIGIGRHADPTALRLRGYWPALITFGGLLAGGLYFAVVALYGPMRIESGALALAAAAASAQLLTEAWRGLSAYAYPVHDIRLVLIVVFAALSGSALALFAWTRVYTRGHGAVFAAALSMAVLAALAARGFDLKAVMSLLVPVLFAIGALAWPALRGSRPAQMLTGVLAVFAALLLLAPSSFLDRVFFQAMALLLFVLFIQQAARLAHESRRRREEEGRAQRLEAALARTREREMPTRLSLASAGRVDLVEADSILRCQGAGDYVELYLASGACLLHDATLNALEESLPASFLRVHRSHIVNTDHIAALERDASGVGTLTLSDGSQVPVSRRIMPSVRSALRGARPSPA